MITIPTSVAEVAEQVCCLPVMLAIRGNASLVTLLEETGYPKFEGEIDVKRLRSAVGDHRGVVEAWLSYSSEKQENWGWFFEGPHKGTYLVGCRTSFSIPPRPFTDPFEACACYIKEEIGAIRGNRSGSPWPSVSAR